MLPKRSKPYCAYTRAYMRVYATLSLLTMFNMEMSNTSNKANSSLFHKVFAVNDDVAKSLDR